MKYVFLCLSVLLLSLGAHAQIGSEKETFEFFQVEKKAEYVGGSQEMNIFIGSNLNYPDNAIECDCEGKVYVEFVIRKNGEVDDVRIARSIIECVGPPIPKKKDKDKPLIDCERAMRSMETESIRVISSMPDWEPAVIRDKPVNMKFRLPLMFKLN